MYMQKLGEILDVKALSADELIEYHLKTLAKWTVRDDNNYYFYVHMYNFFCSKAVIRKMACCLLVLGTFRINKYLKLLVHIYNYVISYMATA